MTPGFLNDNENRDYPFVALTTGGSGILLVSEVLSDLPKSAIVDFGCIIGCSQAYDPAADSVYLHSLTREDDEFIFEFRCTAASLEDYCLVFRRTTTDARFAVQHVEAQLREGVESGPVQDCEASVWRGYLVTGNLNELFASLSADGVATGPLQVEPAQVMSLHRSFANSINLANEDRGRATPPEGCRAFCWPFTPGLVSTNAMCLTGGIRLIEGHNCLVVQDSLNNVIEISAAVGAGAGEPCEEFALFPEEEPYEQSSLLSGGPGCNSTIRAINGKGGPILNLLGGTGVSVIKAPGKNHVVDILVNLEELSLCYDPPAEDECEDIGYSEDICECGPDE